VTLANVVNFETLSMGQVRTSEGITARARCASVRGAGPVGETSSLARGGIRSPAEGRRRTRWKITFFCPKNNRQPRIRHMMDSPKLGATREIGTISDAELRITRSFRTQKP
jgi:hypothetical protein